MISMTDSIKEGRILIEAGTHMPATIQVNREAGSGGWAAVEGLDRHEIEKKINEAGWNFFYMAGRIEASAFGFDKQKTLQAALQRVITIVKSQRCNSLEITQVRFKSFLTVPYVTVSAHSRHVQQGRVFAPASALGERTAPPGMFQPQDDERAAA